MNIVGRYFNNYRYQGDLDERTSYARLRCCTMKKSQ